MSLDILIFIVAGVGAGIGVAAGTFAFFLVIRVIPRMIQKAKLEDYVVCIENTVILGVLVGAVVSLFSWQRQMLPQLLGQMLIIVFGLSSGIFAGCIAIALAEILDTFPIFFRRLKLKESDNELVIWVMAFGKMLGSLFYFLSGYGILGK